MNFIKDWKAVFLSITIIAIPFLIWDVYFTKEGIWGFNPMYLVGINIGNLPLEEVLFFICIPYASIFIHYALNYFFKDFKLSLFWTKAITWLFILFAFFILIIGYPKMYTTVNFTIFLVLMVYAVFNALEVLQQFYISYLVILIPFFIVNGILTGSFIEQEIVWYNDNQNLGIRLYTIPVEDLFYSFNMLFPAVVLIEKFKIYFKKF